MKLGEGLIPAIGKTLRAYRERTGRQQAEVAAAAGISPSMLSQIERGSVSPSIDTLSELCSTLGVQLADLFARLAPRRPVTIAKPGKRLERTQGNSRYEQLVSSPDFNHPAEMFLLEVAPGGELGKSTGGHEGIEMAYVLAGAAILTVEGVEYELAKGDSVSFASQLPHALRCAGRVPFRAVWSVFPPHQDYLELEEN
jgi:transcriptional regulator with XRE-family HTH domain